MYLVEVNNKTGAFLFRIFENKESAKSFCEALNKTKTLVGICKF